MRKIILLALSLSAIFSVHAHTFSANQDVVGQLQTTVVKSGDTLAQVARDHDMGYVEMEEANPGIDDPDRPLTPGTVLVIPSQFILPNAPHRGIVVNLAEMRLYYYSGNQVITHPIGIGREGEDTPVSVLKIIEHIPNPTWYVPDSIRKMRAAQGVFLPRSVPPGPDNPLGNYAMRLSTPPKGGNYLMHGTNDPLGGIGRRSSSGCMRMYPEDIKTLYNLVQNGTPVYVVNEPYKAGWSSQGDLYLESHIPLNGGDDQVQKDAGRIRQIVEQAAKGKNLNVNWDTIQTISEETQGLPQVIARPNTA